MSFENPSIQKIADFLLRKDSNANVDFLQEYDNMTQNRSLESSVVSLIETLGVTSFFLKDMPNDVRGEINYDNGVCTISLNENRDLYRNMFTLAHELGHFILHNGQNKSDKRDMTNYSPQQLKEEREADEFAFDLMLPEAKFKQKFSECRGDLYELQKFFFIAENLIEVRARSLGLLFS